ncbi:MAG TPA: HYR domain-containing protein, partial [Bacteroidales bacterium]|nr:HYR domain-containing protein [Bacteroidales bacterium]
MKNIPIIQFLLLCPSLLLAQPSPVSTLGTISTTAGTANVEVTVTGFNSIVSGDVKFTYDPLITQATGVSVSPLLGGFNNINLSVPGEVRVAWYTFSGVTVANGTAIFTISFTKVANGTTSLSFLDDLSGASCQFYNANGPLPDLPTGNFWIDGSLTFQAAGNAPLTSIGNYRVCTGSMLDVPVIVSNFNSIGSISLTMAFDTGALSYQGATPGSGFPGLAISHPIPGVVFCGGFSMSGISLPDLSTLYTLHFKYKGGSSALHWSDNGTSCEYADQNFIVLNDQPTATFYHDGGLACSAEPPGGTPPPGQSNISACFVNPSTLPQGVPAWDAQAAMSGYADSCGQPVASASLISTSITGNDCSWQVVYTFTVTDSCGNTLNGQTITHSGHDFLPPPLTGSIPAGGSNLNLCYNQIPTGPTEAEIAAQFTDQCGAEVIVTKSGTPSGSDADWNVTYTYKVEDSCGNVVVPSPSVSYAGGDREAPSITCPTPAPSYSTDAGSCILTVPDNALDPLVGDNCNVNNRVNDHNISYTLNGATFPKGTTHVTWTVTDGVGLTNQCSYDLVVLDAEDPSVTCPIPAASYPTDAGQCFATLDYSLSSGDNCPGESIAWTATGANPASGTGSLVDVQFPKGST